MGCCIYTPYHYLLISLILRTHLNIQDLSAAHVKLLYNNIVVQLYVQLTLSQCPVKPRTIKD